MKKQSLYMLNFLSYKFNLKFEESQIQVYKQLVQILKYQDKQKMQKQQMEVKLVKQILVALGITTENLPLILREYFYDFQQIITLIKQISFPQTLKKTKTESVLLIQNIPTLKQKIKQELILFVVLNILFKNNLELKKIEDVKSNRNKFINTVYNSNSLLLEAFLDYSVELRSTRLAPQHLINLIESTIKQNNKRLIQDKSVLPVEIIEEKDSILYCQKIKLQYELGEKLMYPNSHLLYQSKIKIIQDENKLGYGKGRFSIFLHELIKKTKTFLKLEQIQILIDELMMLYGITIMYETVKHKKWIPDFEIRAEDERQEKLFNVGAQGFDDDRLIGYNNIIFELKINPGEPSIKRQFSISLRLMNKHRCELSKMDFYLQQMDAVKFFGQNSFPTTQNSKETKTFQQKYVLVNNGVYLINCSQMLGRGNYGTVAKGTFMQLQNIVTVVSKQNYYRKTLYMRKRDIAAKKLARNTYEYVNEKIEKKPTIYRQTIILNLLKQIDHKEKIKQVGRAMGIQDVERDMVGLQNILFPIQIFKIASLDPQKNPSVNFLIFDKCDEILNNKQRIKIQSKNNKQSGVKCQNMYNIFKQICEGLYCLHFQINNLYPKQMKYYYNIQNGKNQQVLSQSSLSILHRNIKPANIMLNINSNYSKSKVFIIDYGMAKITNLQLDFIQTDCGTVYYMAPQIKNGKKYDSRVDMWSVGIMLFQMINNYKKIYPSNQSFKICRCISEMEKNINQLENGFGKYYRNQWFKLTRKLLSVTVDKRFTSHKALKFMLRNQFNLNGFNTMAVEQKECVMKVQIIKNNENDSKQNEQNIKQITQLQELRQINSLSIDCFQSNQKQNNIKTTQINTNKKTIFRIDLKSFISMKHFWKYRDYQRVLACVFSKYNFTAQDRQYQINKKIQKINIKFIKFQTDSSQKYYIVISDIKQQNQRSYFMNCIQSLQQFRPSAGIGQWRSIQNVAVKIYGALNQSVILIFKQPIKRFSDMSEFHSGVLVQKQKKQLFFKMYKKKSFQYEQYCEQKEIGKGVLFYFKKDISQHYSIMIYRIETKCRQKHLIFMKQLIDFLKKQFHKSKGASYFFDCKKSKIDNLITQVMRIDRQKQGIVNQNKMLLCTFNKSILIQIIMKMAQNFDNNSEEMNQLWQQMYELMSYVKPEPNKQAIQIQPNYEGMLIFSMLMNSKSQQQIQNKLVNKLDVLLPFIQNQEHTLVKLYALFAQLRLYCRKDVRYTFKRFQNTSRNLYNKLVTQFNYVNNNQKYNKIKLNQKQSEKDIQKISYQFLISVQNFRNMKDQQIKRENNGNLNAILNLSQQLYQFVPYLKIFFTKTSKSKNKNSHKFSCIEQRFTYNSNIVCS